MIFDIDYEPFWTSDCEKYTCAITGTSSRGYGLRPKYLGHDWDECYDKIMEIYGDDLHRFSCISEAKSAFSILSEGLIQTEQ